MKNVILLIFILCINLHVNAQGGAAINTTGSTANPSAILDVSSTNAGILIPRMTEAQKTAITSPANGLMIYQTDGLTGFWYYNGTLWAQAIGPAGPTGSAGIAGVTGATGPTGASFTCSAASAGETLLIYNGCLYVKSISESGTYTWANAVSKCSGYGSGWYLPNKMELDFLYQNCTNSGTCGGTCLLNGFAGNETYWSSTLCGSPDAWHEYFGNGFQQYSNGNTSSYNVRCVRR